MQIEVDLDEAFDAFCERASRKKLHSLSVKDLSKRAFQVLDTAQSWSDMGAALILIIDGYPELKEHIKSHLSEEPTHA